MPNVDQFESVFRSAVHDTFSHQRIELSTVLFVTDLTGDQARTFADRTRQFLKTLSHGDKPEWTVVFGANLGGNITPIGSASTLVAVTIIHKYKLPMSFGGFVKMALPYAAVQLVLATAYVLIFLR